MSPEVRRAYGVFRQQGQRCTNPNSPGYRRYGARGIRVRYTSREFIGWFLYQLAKNPGLKAPSCGRIDHDKDYSFDNIELVEHAENSREANHRWGQRKLVKVMAKVSNVWLHFRCVGEAARVFRVSVYLLRAHLDGRIESPVAGVKFRYCLATDSRTERNP
jgi:hypothetical protein